MQTTGLFSSSSPQQANVGGGSSLIGTLGAALVLVFGVVLLTGLSLDRTQTAMVRFLAEKGVALVTALESGVRSGTRSRTGIRLQYLVEELADRPDVRFIAVTMPDGTILAHSNPARVGEVQIFAGQVTLAQPEMIPETEEDRDVVNPPIVIPEHSLFTGDGGSGPDPMENCVPRVLDRVIIPKNITVHLGKPAASARNVTVSFRDYITNVASSEVYPTWADENNPTGPLNCSTP